MARRPLATASKVSGIGQRWTFGPLADRPREDAIAELHAVTRDHVVLGHALVAVQLDGWPGYDRPAELYRAAGADAQVTASGRGLRAGVATRSPPGVPIPSIATTKRTDTDVVSESP
jgi:hypothetical protein